MIRPYIQCHYQVLNAMKRRILLPTDFSKNAQNAMDYAINLYKKDSCVFYILNTYTIEPFTLELAAERYLREAKQKSISGLQKNLERLTNVDDSDCHEFHWVSECGSFIEIMKALIDKFDIDIVVMGTQGDTDSRTQIYGSQTLLAMERIRNCPVLAVPSKAIFKGIKEIVFPTGYKTHYKRSEFQHLVDIAKNTGAAIRILHILDKDKLLNKDQLDKQEHLKDYFEGLEYSFHTLQDTEVQSALDTFIEIKNMDMSSLLIKSTISLVGSYPGLWSKT